MVQSVTGPSSRRLQHIVGNRFHRSRKTKYTAGKRVPAPSSHSKMTPRRNEEGTITSAGESQVATPQEPEVSLPHDQTESNIRHRLSIFCHTYNPQKVFENRGSTARDHLASERTFLAYVRTSLALASTGVALVQLFTIADLTSRSYNAPLTEIDRRIQRFARPLGIASVLLGLIMLATGLSHSVFPPPQSTEKKSELHT
jgi:uncharacterized membrane protein YidH (DUF202 family)